MSSPRRQRSSSILAPPPSLLLVSRSSPQHKQKQKLLQQQQQQNRLMEQFYFKHQSSPNLSIQFQPVPMVCGGEGQYEKQKQKEIQMERQREKEKERENKRQQQQQQQQNNNDGNNINNSSYLTFGQTPQSPMKNSSFHNFSNNNNNNDNSPLIKGHSNHHQQHRHSNNRSPDHQQLEHSFLSPQRQTDKKTQQQQKQISKNPQQQKQPQHIRHTFICQCDMCRQYQKNKLIQILQINTKIMQKKVNQKIQLGNSISTQYYFQLLKKLTQPHNKIIKRSIDLFIPEICFFNCSTGQAKGMFMNRELHDPYIKRFPKSSIQPSLISKVFNDRRKEYRENIKRHLIKEIKMLAAKQQQQNQGQYDYNSNNRSNTNSPTLLNFISRTKTNTKNPMMQSMMSGISNNNNHNNNHNINPFTNIRQQKDCSVLIKHSNGYEQIMNQTQFVMLTMKRRQDPVWKSIELIKNIIHVQAEQKDCLFSIRIQRPAIAVGKGGNNSNCNSNKDNHNNNDDVDDDADNGDTANIKYKNLFNRTKILMRIYAANILQGNKQYISDKQQKKFMDKLIEKNKEIYAQYCVYKILNFIEYFYDERIMKISCKIQINQLNEAYLNEVTSLKKEKLLKYTWTDETYHKKIQEHQRINFLQKPINQQLLANNKQVQENSTKLIKLMSDNHQQMRYKYGLSLQEKQNPQQGFNNQFFRKLHPQITQNITDLVKQTQTVDQFKRKYLNYKQQKKPIVKQFQSHLIKILHKTTPMLRRATSSSTAKADNVLKANVNGHVNISGNVNSLSNRNVSNGGGNNIYSLQKNKSTGKEQIRSILDIGRGGQHKHNPKHKYVNIESNIGENIIVAVVATNENKDNVPNNNNQENLIKISQFNIHTENIRKRPSTSTKYSSAHYNINNNNNNVESTKNNSSSRNCRRPTTSSNNNKSRQNSQNSRSKTIGAALRHNYNNNNSNNNNNNNMNMNNQNNNISSNNSQRNAYYYYEESRNKNPKYYNSNSNISHNNDQGNARVNHNNNGGSHQRIKRHRNINSNINVSSLSYIVGVENNLYPDTCNITKS